MRNEEWRIKNEKVKIQSAAATTNYKPQTN
jgi:hypothetical protein